MEKNEKEIKNTVRVPDIFGYLDYRKYLKDCCVAKKEANPHFSYRYLSGKIGLKSGGFFSWVLQGKRNITDRLVLEIARFFQLNRAETTYFELLVDFNQARVHQRRKEAFEKLLALRRGSVKQVRVDQFEFYRKWYYPAVRELVSIIDLTDGTVAGAAGMLVPQVTPSEVKKAISVLERLNLIQKDGDGVYRRCDQILSSREHVPLVALQEYQIGCIELAKSVFDRFGRNERESSTVTMSIDNEAYLRIIERLETARADIMEIARAVKNPSRVMQLNLQFFPLTRQQRECNEQ